MSIRSRINARGDARTRTTVDAALTPGEQVEIAFSGVYGSLSTNDYGSPTPSPTAAMDPFDVYLTSERMLAVRRSLYGRRAPAISIACDRRFAHVSELRRNALYDRLRLVFKDETLGLTVFRHGRDAVSRLDRALADG